MNRPDEEPRTFRDSDELYSEARREARLLEINETLLRFAAAAEPIAVAILLESAAHLTAQARTLLRQEASRL